MKNPKPNPELAAHNVALAITQASISNDDREILACHSAGKTPDILKLVEYSSRFYDVYNAVYENAYKYFESK